MTNYKTTSPAERQGVILKTALKLFTERGYFNTSVHDIQKAAGISIGSIYHHFGNKEAIAIALYRSIEEQMDKAIVKIHAKHQTAEKRCKAVITYLFETTENDMAAMQYLLYAKHKEFMPDEKPVCSSKPFMLMKAIVMEGIENGEIIKIDPNVAAVSIFGGAIRLLFLRMDGVLEQPLSSFTDEIWDCAWRSVSL